MQEPLHLSTQRGFDLLYAENTPDIILSTACYFGQMQGRYQPLVCHTHPAKFSYLTNAKDPLLSKKARGELKLQRSLIHMSSQYIKVHDAVNHTVSYEFQPRQLRQVSVFKDVILMKEKKADAYIIQASRTNIEKIAIFIEAYYTNPTYAEF